MRCKRFTREAILDEGNAGLVLMMEGHCRIYFVVRFFYFILVFKVLEYLGFLKILEFLDFLEFAESWEFLKLLEFLEYL